MRVEPFSKRDQYKVTHAVIAGDIWKGSREGHKVKIWRAMADGRKIKAQIKVECEWVEIEAGTVGAVLIDLNNFLRGLTLHSTARRHD